VTPRACCPGCAVGRSPGNQSEDVFLVTGFNDDEGRGGDPRHGADTYTVEELIRTQFWRPGEYVIEPPAEVFWDGTSDSLPVMRGWSGDGERLDRRCN